MREEKSFVGVEEERRDGQTSHWFVGCCSSIIVNSRVTPTHAHMATEMYIMCNYMIPKEFREPFTKHNFDFNELSVEREIYFWFRLVGIIWTHPFILFGGFQINRWCSISIEFTKKIRKNILKNKYFLTKSSSENWFLKLVIFFYVKDSKRS